MAQFGILYQGIFDSSLSWDWKVRLVFQDMVILSGFGDEVRMGKREIAHRTKVPFEIVDYAIGRLLEPDPESKTQDHEGRRLALINPEYEYSGYIVLNKAKHRKSNYDERKAYKAAWARAYRERMKIDKSNQINVTTDQVNITGPKV